MEVFKFENEKILYALLGLIPLLLLFIYYRYWRNKTYQLLGNTALINQLIPERSSIKYIVKYFMLVLIFSLMIFGMSNPQMGIKYEKVKRKGIDVIIALDVSKSMLAEDIKPNRLERSKQFISRFIDNLSGDRIGLIVFAGKAFLQLPITTDYAAAKIFLKNINTEMIPLQGTAIAEAIELSNEAFDQKDKKHKALIIITDGENHEGNVLEAVETVNSNGTKIYTLGIGSTKGAPIPVYKNSVQVDFKRDNNGNIVLTKLNETALQQLAVKGGGKYFKFNTGSQEIENIVSEIKGMEKKEFEELVFTDYENQFQYFFLIVLFLLIIEFFITEKRSLWWLKLKKLFFEDAK